MPNPEIRCLKITTSKETRDFFREVKAKMESVEGMEITDGQCLMGLLIAYEELCRIVNQYTKEK